MCATIQFQIFFFNFSSTGSEMKAHARIHSISTSKPVRTFPPTNHHQRCGFPAATIPRRICSATSFRHRRRVMLSLRCCRAESESRVPSRTRRDMLLTPLVAIGVCVAGSAIAKAEDKPPESAPVTETETVVEEEEEEVASRIYDATVIGEPTALGKDKRKVWEKLMNARVVYLGEAEQVPTRDDKVLELEIVRNLRRRCLESERSISLAMEAFPCDMQDQLNQFMDRRYNKTKSRW